MLFLQDRAAAEVGINQTRKELDVSDRALRSAWRRHGLGLPARSVGPAGPRRPDAAFAALNRRLLPARQPLAGMVNAADPTLASVGRMPVR